MTARCCRVSQPFRREILPTFLLPRALPWAEGSQSFGLKTGQQPDGLPPAISRYSDSTKGLEAWKRYASTMAYPRKPVAGASRIECSSRLKADVPPFRAGRFVSSFHPSPGRNPSISPDGASCACRRNKQCRGFAARQPEASTVSFPGAEQGGARGRETKRRKQ